jgi:hypothetical protein
MKQSLLITNKNNEEKSNVDVDQVLSERYYQVELALFLRQQPSQKTQ